MAVMVGSPFRLENRKTIKSISNECRGVFPGEYQNSVRPKLPLLTECQKSVQPAGHPKTECPNSIRKLQDRKQSIKIVSGNSGAKVRVSKRYQKSITKISKGIKKVSKGIKKVSVALRYRIRLSKKYQKSINGTSGHYLGHSVRYPGIWGHYSGHSCWTLGRASLGQGHYFWIPPKKAGNTLFYTFNCFPVLQSKGDHHHHNRPFSSSTTRTTSLSACWPQVLHRTSSVVHSRHLQTASVRSFYRPTSPRLP